MYIKIDKVRLRSSLVCCMNGSQSWSSRFKVQQQGRKLWKSEVRRPTNAAAIKDCFREEVRSRRRPARRSPRKAGRTVALPESPSTTSLFSHHDHKTTHSPG